MIINYEYLTVRLANVLKMMNIKYEQDVLHVVVPVKGSRVYNHSMAYSITTRVREEFVEFQLEMRYKYL
jgi:hypothetical protein